MILVSFKSKQLFLFLLFFVFISHCEEITFCYKDKQCYEINDKTFKDKWKSQLNEKLYKVESLRIYDLLITEKDFVTLLSHKLPQLKRLIMWNNDDKNPRRENFVNNLATPKMIEAIFTSSYFEKLQELDLSHTNIQFRHFQFLKNLNRTLNSKLKTFILNGNYLEQRAFKLLEKINFNGNLQTLALSESSLITPQSVESILKMIKLSDGSKSHVKNLTLYNTGIKADSMIKLLENVEISDMTYLNIAYNPFQHSKSFAIPFNNTIYDYLSSLNFSSLRGLNLNFLDLDEQQLPYFARMKLPSLEALELNQNFLTNAYFQQWITKKNMPRLRRLSLRQTSIEDQSLKFLVQQNFPNLSELYLFNNRKLTPKHLEILSAINSSKWTHIELSRNSIFQFQLREFFEGKSFQNLQQLTMQYNDNCFRLFEFLPWPTMKKLKYLQIHDTDITWSVQHIINSNMTFPSLKHWKFGGNWLKKEYLNSMVRDLIHFGPQLQLVEVKASSRNQHTAYVNISELDFATVPIGMYLRVNNYMTIYKPENGTRFEFTELIFADQRSNFYSSLIHYSFFGVYDQTDTRYTSDFLFENELLQMACEYLLQIVTFENLEHIYYYLFSDSLFIKKLFFRESQKVYDLQYKKYVQEGVDCSKTVYMPYLRSISYIYADLNSQQAPYFYFLNKIQMPLLSLIDLRDEIHPMFIKFARGLLSRTPNLHALSLERNRLNCPKINELFTNLTLPFLRKLILNDNQIQTQCLSSLMARHQFVRNIQFGGNFLEKGLFDQVFTKNELMFSTLVFQKILVGDEEFAKISKINREFIVYISAQTTDITSQGILWLVGNTTTEWLFPRIVEIVLKSNDINETGIKTLLETGMPYLRQLHSLRLTNPNMINNILSYPNRYGVIDMTDQQLFGLSKQIDPRSTRHVQTMSLQSSVLVLEDYEVLSRLDFSKLSTLDFIIENIFECSILKFILQIAQGASNLHIQINNGKVKGKFLDDKCLDPNPPNQIYMPHLTSINVQWNGREYAYIPNFYTYMYSKNQIVESLVLSNGLIGDEILLGIVQNCNLEYLYSAVLDHNMLTDRSISLFFEAELKMLRWVYLDKNQITSEGLKSVVGRSFSSLRQISLAFNMIDDQGIKYLTQAEFPQLQFLTITGNDIRKSGFFKLFDINAPKLAYIFARNILMTEEDIMEVFQLVSPENLTKLPFLTQIQTNIRIGKTNQQRIRKILEKKFKKRRFTITFQKYYIKSINKAIA